MPSFEKKGPFGFTSMFSAMFALKLYVSVDKLVWVHARVLAHLLIC